MIPNFRDFGKIFYSLLVVEQPFSLPKLSTSDKSDYVNAIEEMGDSQEDKGKSHMFSASHAIRKQGPSSRERPPDILRALPPLLVDDNQHPIPTTSQTMKILIGTEEVDVGDLRDWPNISIKPKPVKPPDECIDKNVIHTPPPLEVLQIGDYVEIWTKQCSNMGHLIPLIWVEPFVIDLPWGSLGHFVSNPVGERLITPIHCTNIIFRCFHYHPPIFHLSSFISHHLYIFHLLHAFWFYLHSCIFL